MSLRKSLALFGCVGIILSSVVPSAWAGGLPDDGVAVKVLDDTNGAYAVEGSFTVPTPVSTVWKVLTDYDSLGSFIPSMRSSIVDKPGTDSLLVAQETTTWFLAVPKRTRVVLKVQEDPDRRIAFTDVARRDFDLYQGTWQLEKTPGGTRIEYVASARPKIRLPLLGKSLCVDTVRTLLSALRREMVRRRDASPTS